MYSCSVAMRSLRAGAQATRVAPIEDCVRFNVGVVAPWLAAPPEALAWAAAAMDAALWLEGGVEVGVKNGVEFDCAVAAFGGAWLGVWAGKGDACSVCGGVAVGGIA